MRSARWQVWLGTCLLVSLFSAVALGQLSQLLQGMHLPGSSGFGMGSLSGLFDPHVANGPGRVARIASTWQAYRRSLGPSAADFASPKLVVRLSLAISSFLFLPSVALSLLLLLRRGRGRLQSWREEPRGVLLRTRLLQRGVPPAQLLSGVKPEEYERAVAEESETIRSRASWYQDHQVMTRIAVGAVGTLLAAGLLQNLAALLATEGVWDRLEGATSGRPAAVPLASRVAAVAMRFLAGLKWVSAVLIVLPGLLLVLVLALAYDRETRQILHALRLVRAHIVLLILLAAMLLVHQQVPDVIRAQDGGQVALSVILTIAVALTCWDTARRLVRRVHLTAPIRRSPPPILVALAVTAVGLLVLGAGLGPGVLVPAAMAWVVALLALSLPSHREDRWWRRGARPLLGDEPLVGPLLVDWEDRFDEQAIPRALVTLTLVIVGLAYIRASFADFVYTRGWAGGPARLASLLVALGPLLAAAGWGLHLALARWFAGPQTSRTRRLPLWAAGAAAGLLVGVFVLADVWGTSSLLGSIGLLVAFLLLAIPAGAALVWIAEVIVPPHPFRVIGLRRIPVLSLLLAWLLLASALDRGAFHGVRTDLAVPPRRGDRISLSDAFDRWLGRNSLPPLADAAGGQARPPGERPVVPLLLVASAGGGSRAAFWTGLVLDCVLEGGRAGPVGRGCGGTGPGFDARARESSLMAGSGVSGGSLGLSAYVAHLVDRSVRSEADGENWVERRLGGDFLSASLAWGLFAEIPRLFLRFGIGPDRAAVLEQTWERRWAGPGPVNPMTEGLVDLWYRHPGVPAMILNGVSARDGCRLNVSPLDLSVPGAERDCLSVRAFEADRAAPGGAVLGATRDVVDFLCDDRDIRLSTATLLSARFPFVSPSGRLASCSSGPGQLVVNVVDGGYLDISGASTLVELWGGLEPMVAAFNRSGPACVVPFFVQIDNGYADLLSPHGGKVWEVGVPPLTLLGTLQARSADARLTAALLFSRPFTAGGVTVERGGTPLADRFAYFRPRAHPGSQAPLGWDLSRTAMDDLEVQLSGQPLNAQAVKEVGGWYGHDLTCRTAP